ncbi:MAG: DEAD/DEAH box helicase [Sediminibacterium sp.]
MQFTPRPYQTEAIDAAVTFFRSDEQYNAFEILPTGSGKSVVIANIAKELQDKTIVFQPSKEILEQNYKKFISYGFRAGIYSASAGSKFIDRVTFATIGSVAKKRHLFKDFKNIIIDECHLVNANDGMYRDFIKGIPGAKVLGLTATPYRLSADFEGAQLKFLNRTNPRIFNKVLYYIQNKTLFDAGHLCPLEYFTHDVVDRSKLKMNNAGTDFTDASVKDYYKQINMPRLTTEHANRLLKQRRNLLVFCSLVSEAQEVSAGIPGSVVLTGETSDKERERILSQFKAGIIKCLINVGVLTTGFDYPELETVLIARSTMSLALYYQIVGRAMRPHEDKPSAWIVDLGGNINLFGKIETMEIRVSEKGLFSIWNNNRQLTNVPFSRN